MKKSFIRNISLWISALLGLGALAGINSLTKKEVKEVGAASEVLWRTFNFSDTFINDIEESNAVDGFWITWSREGTGNTATMEDGALHMHVVEPGGRNFFQLFYRIPSDVEICKIEVDAIPGVDASGVGGRNQNFSIQGNLDGEYADRQYIQRSGSSSATTKSTFTFTTKEEDGPIFLNKIKLGMGTETKNRNTQFTFDTYFWEMRFYKVVNSQPVTISAGTGIQSVYLSESSTATSGSASGTNFDIGKTVYGFATLKAGYSAPNGWTNVGGSTYCVGSKTVSESGASFGTLNANVAKYTISYNLNGGTVSSANPTEYYVTTNDFTLNNPTKTGYTFAGWSGTGISGTSTSVKVSKGSTGNRSYTANWTANTYTVSYNANKPSNATGNVTGLPANATWTYDSNATLGAAPSLTGWTFGGWYKEADCINKLGNASQVLTKPNLRNSSGTVTLYAKWTANTYNVTYQANKPSAAPTAVTDMPNDDTWTYDTNATLGSAPKLTGYDFKGWYKEASCTNKVGDAGEAITKPNLIATNGGNVNLYAKWDFNAEIQAVIDKINDVKNSSYEALTDKINIADTAYNALPQEYKDVVDSNLYTKILDEAKAADYVGDLIEALGPSEDTPKWREKVQEAREAYNNLADPSYIPVDLILQILVDDEAAIVVMDLINNIGEVHWTHGSKNLIDTANNAYESYINNGHPANQIANYQTLVDANIDYDNVQGFVDKVNAITANPFEYTSECKALIDDARDYYENTLDDDQKYIVSIDAYEYYNLLVNYENVYNAMNLIDLINEMENDPSCGIKIKDARDAIDALDPENEYSLVNDELLKELDDKEAAWNVIELINAIYPMSYSEETQKAIKEARQAYDALTDEQKALVVNYDMLSKAEEDFARVKEVIELVDAIGQIRYDEDSLEAINQAREAYEALTSDQKALYPESYLQEIVDYETSYVVLEKIYEIGNVSYDTESEDKVNEAREYFDSLSEEQKGKIYIDDFLVLTNAEDDYKTLKDNAIATVIIFLIITCILLVLGILVLIKLLKKKEEDKGAVKAMSIGGVLPFMILISHYADIAFIILYIIAALTILVWGADLAIWLNKKFDYVGVVKDFVNRKILKKEEPIKVEEKKVEEPEVVEETKESEDEEETVTVTDAKGNIFQIRYIKSFTAKLIQAPEETKKYYEELKNEVLSYKKTTSRISWHFDSINSGRNQLVKFAVKGKTLCVYLALNADEYMDTKYKVEKVESKKYEDVPCLYRIKNDRRLGYAKDLIAKVAEKFELVKGEEKHEVYSDLPYEENKPLIERGLIKELKVQVNKPEEEVVETKVNAEGDEIVITKDSKGNMFEIRYVKSFTAKLSQSPDETKDYYSILKNYVLSYKGPHSRVSWHHDAINLGRDYIIKFAIRGKTLCVYFALDASKLESKYKVEEAKGKRFEEVPVLYRIKNDRRLEYAKELIDMLMNNLGIQRGKELNDEYRIPFEETKVLLAKGLIKEVKTKVTPKEVMESVSVEEADKLMSDVKAEASIEEDNTHHRRQGLKDIINIDTLSKNYNDGDEVTLDSLIEKKLISPKVGYVKVLGRGVLDKKLTVVLNDYSLQAVKMIVLTGGHAKKIK